MARGGVLKAQTMIFERVLLFMVGVVIFIACFMIFLNYQDYFLEVSVDDQLDDVGKHISSTILKLAEKQNQTEASISIEIPSKVGNEVYSIHLSCDGLNITTTVTGRNRLFKLYGLSESFEFGGETIYSTVSELMIYKKGNRIILL